MDASTARWAERPAPSFNLGGGMSKKESYPRLDGLIRFACESMTVSAQQRYAPENMDAQAAVCDEIISKGVETNAACYAVYMIVQKYVNGSVLDHARRALQLLDSCVKNCGDSCHLAISEKDFLNELVRKFGPAPPPKNIIQQDVLKLIETWHRTIAQKSFIKDDLGYIRDMRRLLDNKGFIFPEPDPDDINALNGLEVKGLQTEDALKERRNLALKAKLQAYLRRGGNRNLQEANKIIKILSDYDQSDKSEIRQEAADRIQDVRERTQLLTERLKAFKPGDKLAAGDAFESLVDDLKSEQHKLHNTLQNDRESEDSMSVLLTVNEEINRVVEWYDALKAGNFEEANRLLQGGTAKGGPLKNSITDNSANGLSLIDFEEVSSAGFSPASNVNIQDDLLGLSLSDNMPQGTQSTTSTIGNIPIPPGFPIPKASSTSQTQTLLSTPTQKAQGSITSTAQSPKPNYNLSSTGFANGSSQSATLSSLSLLQQSGQNLLTAQNKQARAATNDPFASIASSARASPRPNAESHPPNLADPVSSTPKNSGDSPSESLAATQANDEDWDFSGAPPPEEEDFVVFNEDIKIEFQVSRASDTSLTITAVFSNNTPNPISKLDFRTGMPKLYPRKIDPISSSRLQPHQAHGAYLRFTIDNVPMGHTQQMPRIKWRLSRVSQDASKLNEGEAQPFSIK